MFGDLTKHKIFLHFIVYYLTILVYWWAMENRLSLGSSLLCETEEKNEQERPICSHDMTTWLTV